MGAAGGDQRMMWRRNVRFFSLVCLAFGMSLPAAAQRTKVVAYTAIENEQLPVFKAAIESAVSDVEIEWVRDSTGVITARFLAEKAQPRADILLSLAVSSLIQFKSAGLLDPYTPKGWEILKPQFKDASPPASWFGHDAFLGAICFNTVEGGKIGVASPSSWRELTVPKLEGKVVMSHPGSSGTGYLMVAGWLQMMGEAEGWAFMDALHRNIAVYTHSGSAPCVQSARGERVVGISFDMRGAREKSAGAPIDVIVPAEGTGWDMEATAVVKGAKNAALARKVADWAASEDANRLYAKYYAIVAHPAVTSLPANYPSDAERRMARIDFEKMANERDRIIAEWVRRYETKAAKR
jgi:iron(III) transport system substrate-binding protein